MTKHGMTTGRPRRDDPYAWDEDDGVPLCGFTWTTSIERPGSTGHDCQNLPQHSESHRCGCGARTPINVWEVLRRECAG